MQARSLAHEDGVEGDFPSTSVIICTFDFKRLDYLRQCVSAVLEQDVHPKEIIIVVNDNDELEATLRSEFASVPQVRAISARPRGIATTRSVGLEAASGQLIAFVDDDAIPRSGWLRNLALPLLDPSVMMTAGAIIPRWAGDRPRWFPGEFLWIVGCTYDGLADDVTEVRNPYGASMLFRRDVYTTIGGFDEHFGRTGSNTMGCEETEYAIRAKKAIPNGRILFTPHSQVDHVVPESRSTVSYFLRRCWNEGRAKAQLVQQVGSSDALSSERGYVLRTLVRGVFGRIAHPGQWSQAIAIVAGLSATAMGYGLGRLQLRRV